MPRRRTLTRADLAHAQSWVVPPGQYDPDRAILGIAPDATLVHVVLADPPNGRGYAWEMVGTQDADRYARSRSIWINALHPERTPPAIEIHVRAYRVYLPPPQGVYPPQHEVYVEARLHPTDGVTLHLHQPPDMTLDEDTAIRKALPRAKQLLRTLDQRGRPEGTGRFRNAADFRAVLVTAIQHIHAEGAVPTQAHVAAQMDRLRPPVASTPTAAPLDPRTLRRLCMHYLQGADYTTWDAFQKKIIAPI